MQLNCRLAKSVVVAVIMTVWPAWAFAQCADQELPAPTPWSETAPFGRLITLHTDDCLGGKNDSASIATAVRAALVIQPVAGDPIRDAVEAALDLVSKHARSLNTGPGPGKAVLTEVAQQAEVARTMLGSKRAPAVPTAWDLVDSGRIEAVSLHLSASLRAACRERSDACRDQFETVKEVLRAATLVKGALFVYVRPIVEQHQKETARRAQMWDAYFTGARSQYPWELLLNGRLMKDTRQEEQGVKFGFRDVPNSQVMFLHPDVAFEYASDEPEGNRFAGLVLVDVVGYNRWKWNDDGSMGLAVGGSFIVTMGDHANMDEVGLGVMLHLANRWSVGMTFSGDHRTVLVSGDVAQLWTKISAARKKRLMTGQ